MLILIGLNANPLSNICEITESPNTFLAIPTEPLVSAFKHLPIEL